MAPGSSVRPSSTGCSPKDWRVDAVDDLSNGSLGNLANARSQPDRRFSFHRIDVASPGVMELIAAPPARSDLPPRGSGRRAGLGRASGVRRDRQHPRHAQRLRRRGRGRRRQGDLRRVRRNALRHHRRAARCAKANRKRPSLPTASSKKAAGDYLYYYRQVRGLEYTASAMANVYGPRQDPHGEAGVVSIFAGKVLSHERPMIYGDGSQTRDFVYVDDVVDAFVRGGRQGWRPADEHRHRRRDERPAALRRDGQARGLQAARALRPAADR